MILHKFHMYEPLWPSRCLNALTSETERSGGKININNAGKRQINMNHPFLNPIVPVMKDMYEIHF